VVSFIYSFTKEVEFMNARRNSQILKAVATHGGSKKENECPVRSRVVALLAGFAVCGSVMLGGLAAWIFPFWYIVPGAIVGGVSGLSFCAMFYVAGRAG
jgi:fatty acid desaturase